MSPIAKPHRFLLDRVSSYRDEAKAFANRRRIRSLPFARARFVGGRTVGLDVEGDPGRELIALVDELLAELDSLRE